MSYGKTHTDFSFLHWESETLLEASDSSWWSGLLSRLAYREEPFVHMDDARAFPHTVTGWWRAAPLPAKLHSSRASFPSEDNRYRLVTVDRLFL